MGKANHSVHAGTAVFASAQEEIEALRKENEELRRKMDRLCELLLNAQRGRFGQSSEKIKYVLKDGPEQCSIFNEAEAEQVLKAPEPTEESVAVAAHQRRKKRTNEEALAGLPTEEVVLELQPDQRVCPNCGRLMVAIGKKYIKTEMIFIPQTVKIIKYYTMTYACPPCEKETGFARILSAAAPTSLMKHSLASPSTVADVMTKKYADGLPLARQEKIWKREGVELSRATLANWVIQTTQNWLKPLYRQMKRHLLEQKVIHADETVVQVLKEDGKPASSESRMWVYASGGRERERLKIFEYQPDRKGERARNFLKDFSGCLVTDGYAGYGKVGNALHFGCWSHMRRKWREAMPDGATMETSKAAIGCNYCNKLFAHEKKISGESSQARKDYRHNKEEVLLQEYFPWVDTLRPQSGSKLKEAVTYAKNQKAALCAFLEYGEVDILNNLPENAIRPFVLGRKNWLFCDTPKGAVRNPARSCTRWWKPQRPTAWSRTSIWCGCSRTCPVLAKPHPPRSWKPCCHGIRQCRHP
jgi:transposase